MPIQIINGPTIPAQESLSDVLDVSGSKLGVIWIRCPALWTPTWLTFQVAFAANGPWSELYNQAGQPVQVPVIPGIIFPVTDELVRQAYFKFRSGSAQYPIIQSEARQFTCMLETA